MLRWYDEGPPELKPAIDETEASCSLCFCAVRHLLREARQLRRMNETALCSQKCGGGSRRLLPYNEIGLLRLDMLVAPRPK